MLVPVAAARLVPVHSIFTVCAPLVKCAGVPHLLLPKDTGAMEIDGDRAAPIKGHLGFAIDRAFFAIQVSSVPVK